MPRIKVLFSVLLLSACAPTHFDAEANKVAGKPCPPLVEYSCQQQKNISAALTPLPKDNILRKAMTDYHTLREQCGPPEPCK